MSPSTLRPVRVVGVGSARGDDAVAWEVVRQLRSRPDLSPGVELHSVDGGQRLLDVLDGHGALFLIDAVKAGSTPGTIHRFVWPVECIDALRPGSTHVVGPAEALCLAQAIGTIPAHVVIFGVEIARVDSEGELSPAVRKAVPELVSRLAAELALV